MPTKIVNPEEEVKKEEPLEVIDQEIKPIFEVKSNQAKLDQEALKFLTVPPKLSPLKNKSLDVTKLKNDIDQL